MGTPPSGYSAWGLLGTIASTALVTPVESPQGAALGASAGGNGGGGIGGGAFASSSSLASYPLAGFPCRPPPVFVTPVGAQLLERVPGTGTWIPDLGTLSESCPCGATSDALRPWEGACEEDALPRNIFPEWVEAALPNGDGDASLAPIGVELLSAVLRSVVEGP